MTDQMAIQVNVHLQNRFPSVLDKRPHLSHHKSVKNSTISYKSRRFRQLYRLGERGIHALAVLVVIELGFLSPLSCVLHCFIHDLLRERGQASIFLCDAPSSSSTIPEHELPTSSPIETVRPRAIFETLPPAQMITLVIIVVILLFHLSHPSLLPRLSCAPPTPPPRTLPIFLAA